MNMQPVLSSDISSILGSNFNFTLKKMQKTSKQSISSKKLKLNFDSKNDVAEIYVFADKDSNKNITHMHQIIESKALPRNKSELLESKKQIIFFQGKDSAIWIFHQNGLNQDSIHSGLLNESLYANARDQFGQIYNQIKSQNIKSLKLKLFSCSDLILEGIIIGLELASYQFLNHFSADKKDLKKLMIHIELDSDQSLSMEQIQKIQIKAQAVQLARHLVNLPPNELNPETFEKDVVKKLNLPKSMQITVWNDKKLASENMNLLLAVGNGASAKPRLIHLKYRPQKSSRLKPLAFVGKGITFDTGGLDIKPSSAMRLMKKDMGGAAAVIGLAYWVAFSNYSRPCDFYLALAENSVDAHSMRPSDLYKSRAGYLVEIDNTDAEGRLVLADAMDVAVTQKEKPEIVIDLATLTGAIKVALGTDIAGLFANDDQLAMQINQSGYESGDLNWRMPLHKKYFSSLNSPFADFKNSGEGFGGAITAALFLEKFAAGIKWAHLDIYSWADRPSGCMQAVGGNGQSVQALIHWLKSVEG